MKTATPSQSIKQLYAAWLNGHELITVSSSEACILHWAIAQPALPATDIMEDVRSEARRRAS